MDIVHPSFRVFIPKTTLQPYIKCYAIWAFNGDANNRLNSNIIPIGAPHISIRYKGSYDDSYRGWFRNSELTHQRKLYSDDHIAGQILNNFYHNQSGDTGMLGIVFKPTGLYHLFNLTMPEFTQNAICIDTVLGNQGRDLTERIKETNSMKEKISITENFLESRLTFALKKYDDTEYALNMILNNPTSTIDHVCRYLKVSSRHLRRRFKEKVGIGPKLFLSICRFHHVLQMNNVHPGCDLHDLSFLCGYYDQSHFIKDFKRFSGKTPYEYLIKGNRNEEFAIL